MTAKLWVAENPYLAMSRVAETDVPPSSRSCRRSLDVGQHDEKGCLLLGLVVEPRARGDGVVLKVGLLETAILHLGALPRGQNGFSYLSNCSLIDRRRQGVGPVDDERQVTHRAAFHEIPLRRGLSTKQEPEVESIGCFGNDRAK